MTTAAVGQKIALSLVYLDLFGDPMVPQPTPDAPPTFSSVAQSAEIVSTDGSVLVTALTLDSYKITANVSVGGYELTGTTIIPIR